MKNLIVSLVALSIVGCASKGPNHPVWGSITMGKKDLIEIHEAFKNATQEKTIVLDTMGEAVCAYNECALPVRVTGDTDAKLGPVQTRKVAGKLLFSKASSDAIMSLMEQAYERGKDQDSPGRLGKVICKAESCSIAFWMLDETDVLVDSLYQPKKK